ncbi:hypothetical protein G4O51_01310 [Candidatus Bathyarchaeota archaeon A05DMB-2]|jgi:hypothetical protein|nr:hypothetical protein [Candidatus Bathyarchaeota archaeon A05DMB-2]
MAQDSDKMKALVAFKKRLEERLEKLDAETKEFQAMLDAVNSILLEKGFKRGDIKQVSPPPAPKEEALPTPAEIPAPAPEELVVKPSGAKEAEHAPPLAAEPESVIPLKTLDDEPLAIIYVDKQSIHVLPDERKNFNVNTPPFSHFLVERVLAKMQEKDNELVRMGQLTPDKMFAYNIVREGDLIREIVIRNVDEERLKELKSSIRWTLEKMFEKTKG